MLQNSAFSASIDDHQYRQLYHPSEDYRSFTDNSQVTSPVSSRGSSNNLLKRSSSNLDPIKEENSADGSVKNRSKPREETRTIQPRQGNIQQRQSDNDSNETDTPPVAPGKFYI